MQKRDLRTCELRTLLRAGTIAGAMLGLSACGEEGMNGLPSGHGDTATETASVDSIPTASTDATDTVVDRYGTTVIPAIAGETADTSPALGAATLEAAPDAAIDVASAGGTDVVPEEPVAAVDAPPPVAVAPIPAPASAFEPVAEPAPVVEAEPEPVIEEPARLAAIEPEPVTEPVAAKSEPVIEPEPIAATEPEPAAALPVDDSYRIRIRWRPAATSDLGYYVYYGEDGADVDQLAKGVLVDEARDGDVMTAVLEVPEDLSADAGARVCFTVSAWNDVGETERSPEQCVDTPTS